MEPASLPFPEISVHVTHERYTKDAMMLEHHALLRMISGENRMVLGDRSYVFTAGDTVLLPRHQLASVIKSPKDGRPYKSMAILLTSERLKAYYARNKAGDAARFSGKLQVFHENALLESYFRSLFPFFESDQKLPDELMGIKVEEAISIVRYLEPGVDALFADFMDPDKINLAEFMEKNYRVNMPLERFGYLTGRSLSTFNRDFRRTFATTPQRWLTEKRLEFAHFEIVNRKRRPVEVYLEAGFENLSHFSYAFKKRYGYAPSETTRDSFDKANLTV